MTTKKVFTNKKLLPCLIIDTDTLQPHWYSVLKTDGTFFITNDWTGTCNLEKVNKGQELWPHEKEQEFIEAYHSFIKERNERLAREKQEAIDKENNRIAELRARIEECSCPEELCDNFNLTMVETAGHWSDLYEGRSGKAILISNREEFEIVDFAVSIHGAEGEYGEARRRDGEHHSTLSTGFRDLEDYQKALRRHFEGDKFFYRSQETDAEFYMEQIKNADDMEEIESLVDKYKELEAGYYDCNGNLEMSEDDLNDPDRSGYRYDVYSYSFCFALENKREWKREEEVEEEI